MGVGGGKPPGMLGSFFAGAAATATIFLMIFCRSSNLDSSIKNSLFRYENGTTRQEAMFEDLAPILKRVASYDNTIIMTKVNWAWAKPDSLLDLFLNSFKTGENISHLLNNLLIVALDSKAFERCKLVHPHCYRQKLNANLTAPQKFMSEGYLEVVWSKIRIQQYILEQGYNDVDILWFRNPFRHITVYADMMTACDEFNGNPNDITNYPNNGFFYIKSSNKTVSMMKYWLNARNQYNPPDHEQNIFINIKQQLVDFVRVNIQFLDTKFVGTFCQFSKDMNEICTMHANCCVNGLEAKLEDLRGLVESWKNYTMLSREDRNEGIGQWRKPNKCKTFRDLN